MKIIHTIDEQVLAATVERCRERGILIPTFAQMKDPSLIPAKVRERLVDIGLWDVHPLNLFRISWKNEPRDFGGLYGQGNWLEFPPELTGVDARIIGLVGKWFPTGAHKVGAGFGCLVPRLVSGEFDPTRQKAVWPSTGNFCRGGAFDCALLACKAVAILPEEMSQERFEWLREIGTDEIFATPGCESNVKEIYDKCWELRRERGKDIVIFNQFEEFGNAIWHYHVTGSIIEEIYNRVRQPDSRFGAYISATGSAGTLAAGDYLRIRFPGLRIVATEALQCPTLLQCGFGGHRIEGIGDKHVPWIHNVRNTDAVSAIDDEQTMTLMRLFNEDAGRDHLRELGVSDALVSQLPLLGISSICNLIGCIKTAKYFDMNRQDVLFTPLTDSMDLYQSRLLEQREQHGPYSAAAAIAHAARDLHGTRTDNYMELTYHDRKRLHNFKYFTWVEQQGRTAEELRQLWDPDFWTGTFAQVDEWDGLIEAFNDRTGVLAAL